MLGLVLIYFAFFCGYAIHLMLQVDAIVRAKNNTAVSRLTVLLENWPRLAGRLLFSFIVFYEIRQHPQFLASLLNAMGITLGGTVGDVFSVPLNAPLSAGFGYVVDSMLAFIPLLRNVVPQLDAATSNNKP